jgi:hypothetical protein
VMVMVMVVVVVVMMMMMMMMMMMDTVVDVLCATMCLRRYCPFFNEVHIIIM